MAAAFAFPGAYDGPGLTFYRQSLSWSCIHHPRSTRKGSGSDISAARAAAKPVDPFSTGPWIGRRRGSSDRHQRLDDVLVAAVAQGQVPRPSQPVHRIKQDPAWKIDLPCSPSITGVPTGNRTRRETCHPHYTPLLGHTPAPWIGILRSVPRSPGPRPGEG